MTATYLAAGEWRDNARSFLEEEWLLRDLCGVDRSGIGGEPRFEVVAQLLHKERRERRAVHVAAEGDPPTIPSVVEVWPTANFMEREAYDMFGIRFEGHPNLTRILMPDEWEGHPLRKDYGVGKLPVEFIPQPFLQLDAPGQTPDSMGSRGRVDRLGQLAESEGE